MVDVLPGQAHDAPHLVRMLGRTLGRVPAVGEVAGDKGFDGDRHRGECLDRDVSPNIPPTANRAPGRWSWYEDGYRERNRVGRRFGKAKQFRRVATRYDQLEATYLGLLRLVFGFIRLRAKANVNTP